MGRHIEQPCGTETGYRRHYRFDEPVCEPCRKAHGRYLKARRAPTTSTRLLDTLAVAGGWMNLELCADVLDVDVRAVKKAAYRLRSRGVVEMRVVGDHGATRSRQTEARLPVDEEIPRAWMKDAACHSVDVDFFPVDRQALAEAKAVCEPCPVRVECLSYAIRANVDGVWGGTSEGERRRMLEAA